MKSEDEIEVVAPTVADEIEAKRILTAFAKWLEFRSCPAHEQVERLSVWHMNEMVREFGGNYIASWYPDGRGWRV